MSAFILSQILISIAICSDILSFQFKRRSHIIGCLLVSCILISSHFLLLDHITAACLGVIAAFRFTVSLFSTSRIWLTFFITVTVITSAYTYNGLLSILGCSGALFGTIASFCKEDKLLRQLMCICTSLWIIHNYLAGSPGAVVMELLFLSSNVVGYFRYYIRPKKQVLG